MLSASQRALQIARQARGGRLRRDDGGQTNTPDQQPETSPQASNSYIGAMTQPMGGNISSYAAQSGFNAASALQQQDWSGMGGGPPQGAPQGGGGGGGAPPPQNAPLPPSIQSGPAPAPAPQPGITPPCRSHDSVSVRPVPQ
jgi:hypothetical protein